jgi:glycosyltransferase involved in cell wall biosynthesis
MVYNRGRRLIVLSRAFGNELTEKYGVQEDRIRVIPGGIDTETFNDYISRHEARTRLGWPTDRVIVLAVRRHVRRMGLEALIDAAVQVSKQVPDVLFLLGGVGPISAELAQRTVDQGLAPHVKLIGRISDCDLPLAYRAADVSIVPSQALEGFGMITIESLASGTPVIVTPVGGLPEVVRPFAPECVLDGTGAEIIAATLTDFLLGKRKLPESPACRAYAMRNFSWPRIAAMTKTVYEEALQ